MTIKRTLSKTFRGDLIHPEEGILSPLLTEVFDRREELALCIRDGYINIYYMGGNLLHVKPYASGEKYKGTIDEKYEYAGENPVVIDSLEKAWEVARTFDARIAAMDEKNVGKPTEEKKFQQSLFSANHDGKFVVVDMEVQMPRELAKEIFRGDPRCPKCRPRFDMVGLIAGSDGSYRPALIENKWGGNSLSGPCGLAQHAYKMARFICHQSGAWQKYLDKLWAQATLMQQLDLITLLPHSRIDRDCPPEITFMLGGIAELSPRIEKDIKREISGIAGRPIAIKKKFWNGTTDYRYNDDGIEL